ncbi:host specificity protein J [Silvimonas sp.]|uniref:host specificity protein J n=1 Tax=Silvimonas sp. TaxID=2650811 RepID=UPI00284C559C|nr:host specificity protein J [Silvimonas sp.]MDR3427905.1 host specificity protein J [Silvimonas sp.]
MKEIVGYKGDSSSTRTPVESPDSLHSTAYAKILDLVSEGEIKGLANGLQSVFFDETPLANADGSLNFARVTVDTRTGTQDQTYIAGLPDVENEVGIGVELKASVPWTRAVTNLQLSAVRIRLSVPQLQQSNTSNGDITGFRIEYQMEVSTDGGAYQVALATAFDGKTTSEYQRSHRIDLPAAQQGWVVRVVRTTPNQNSATVADTTKVESITEVIDAKLRYPMSALVFTQFDAAQFTNIPARAFDLYGRILRVPSNYDAGTRNYSGVWDGTFKLAWTDNPAWVFYDLALNDRYGLGHLLNMAQVDKWGLYQIAQYCDQMVPDGKGGQEPRFTCNVYIQDRQDALKVLQDLASVFRGVSYWAGGGIRSVADMPSDPVYTYTAANVIDGKFTYAGSSRKTRYTVALVSWNDPTDFYRQKVEYVENQEGIARYGIQQTEISAFGCVSQGQAQRVGQWALLTSQLETGTVSFSVGLDGVLAAPGQIVRIADNHRAGRRIGGRVRMASGRSVTLDRAPVVATGDSLTVVLPSGISETRTVSLVSDNIITVSTNWSEAIQPESVWLVESSTLTAPTYRVTSVTQKEGLTFEVTAVQHEPGKFANIDTGTRIDTRPITVIPPSVQPPPANVRFSTNSVIDQGLARTAMTIAWDAADKAIAYLVDWRRDNGDWVSVPRTGALNVVVDGIYAGAYVARVRAVNALGVISAPAYSVETALTGKTTPPPVVTFLQPQALPMGIELAWGFPEGALDVERTELWYSRTASRDDAIKLADLAYPQSKYTMMGLAAGVSFFFWARLVDRSGNIGDWYPDGNGVNGQSSSDASEILDYLAGQIGETQLAQDLLKPIQDAAALAGPINDRMDALADQMGDVQQDVTRVDGIVARFSPPMAGDAGLFAGATTVMAGVWSEQYARASADLANAQRIDTVAASIGDYSAAIQSETQARISADGVLASRIDTTLASLGDTSATVQQTSQALASTNGKLQAMWSVKTQVTADGHTYMAGIGVGVDNASGVIESQVLIAADRFAIINPNGTGLVSPFAITGGQVFMNQAFIADGTITNAKIGNVIQSTATGAGGAPRWSLDKTGTLTMTGPNNGGWLTISDSILQVFDANGTLRVRLGIW